MLLPRSESWHQPLNQFLKLVLRLDSILWCAEDLRFLFDDLSKFVTLDLLFWNFVSLDIQFGKFLLLLQELLGFDCLWVKHHRVRRSW